MQPKKILFVSNEYNIGGSSVSLKSLIIGLKRVYGDSVEIEVLLPKSFQERGNAIDFFEGSGIRCKQFLYRTNYKRLGHKTTLMHVFHNVLNALSVVPIRRYIRRNGYEVVCSNSTSVDVGARATVKMHVPHVYYIREVMESGLHLEYRNKKRMKKLLENSDLLIFISKATEAFYLSEYEIKKHVQFYNGFILDDYYVADRKVLLSETISFVQAGGLCDAKGTKNTLDLLDALNQTGICNWNMEFVGNGTDEYIGEMKELIQKYHMDNQVTIGSFCKDMKSKLATKDILIMNSPAEGFGRVTVEGMLAGCLVVGRYEGGTKEILNNKENGITFVNKEDFVLSLQEVFEQREKYSHLAQKGQKMTVQKYSCESTATNFMKSIDGINKE